MRHLTGTVLVCGFMIVSQHMASDGSLWWRQETKAVSIDECRATLKRITGRPKVKMTAWYDATPAQLQEFGAPSVPEKGTWLACWPDGTDLGAPES